MKILFDDKEVDRVVANIITFWNAGNVTLRREDVAEKEPVSFTFEHGNILLAKIMRKSRLSNGCLISVVCYNPAVLKLDFDFLDPDDGVEILVLHTSNRDPVVSGTVKGLSRGIAVLKPY